MTAQTIPQRRVVIAGGGIAALEAMFALRRLAGNRVALALVTPGRELVHRPLALDRVSRRGRTRRFDLATLAAGAGAELISSRLVAVEAERHLALTDDGSAIAYDQLVIASGACPRPALPGAITYWGIADVAEIGELIARLEARPGERIAFAAHASAGWDPPLYDLALLAERRLRGAGTEDRRLLLVTHEDEPLAIFGRRASARVRRLLEQRGIELIAGSAPAAVGDGVLETARGESIGADRVVTLPGLEGPRLEGVPADERGFIPVDALGRVRGLADVHAAGESTAFPVKQGEIAAQQAYATATSVAAAVEAPVEPEPFRPILRGMLLAAEGQPRLVGESVDALWWPADASAGRFLGPHLATILGESLDPAAPAAPARFAVEVELSNEAVAAP